MTEYEKGFLVGFGLVGGGLIWLAFAGADPKSPGCVQALAHIVFGVFGWLLLAFVILVFVLYFLGVEVRP